MQPGVLHEVCLAGSYAFVKTDWSDWLYDYGRGERYNTQFVQLKQEIVRQPGEPGLSDLSSIACLYTA